MKCKCPNCGAKLKIVVQQRKEKKRVPNAEDAQFVGSAVRPRPPSVGPRKVPTPKKFRTNTDAGAFRQALFDAGFVESIGSTIFNDKRDNTRRLKLWGGHIGAAPDKQLEKLSDALHTQFGDRLVDHGPYGASYVVRLEL